MKKKTSLLQKTPARQQTPPSGKQKTTASRLIFTAFMLCMVLTILPIISTPASAADAPTAITSVTWNADYSVSFTTDAPAAGANYFYAIVRDLGDPGPSSDDLEYVSGTANYQGSLSTDGNSATISVARIRHGMSSGVKEAGNYYIRLRFSPSTGVYAYSAPRAITPFPQLGTPQNLTWDGPVAKWDAVSNADEYTLWLYGADGSGQVGGVYTANTTQYNFSKIMTPGKTYSFSVRADDTSSNYTRSGYLLSGNYTMEAATAPTAITSVTWNADYSVSFTTDAPAAGANYFYAIMRDLGDPGPSSDDLEYVSGTANYQGSLSTDGNSATISVARIRHGMSSGVKEAGNYYIRLRFSPSTGVYAYSAPRAITPFPQLGTPQNLTWDGPVAKWDAVSNADEYTLWLYGADGSGQVGGIYIANTTQYNFSKIMTPGKTYSFRVRADDTSSNYAGSGYLLSGNYTMGDTTVDTTKPTVASVTPSGPDAPTKGELVITFSEEMNTDAAGYVKIDTAYASPNGTWSENGRTYTVRYTGYYYGSVCKLSISGFKDLAGNTMTADTSRSFTIIAKPPTYEISIDEVEGGGTLTGGYFSINNTGTGTITNLSMTLADGSSFTLSVGDATGSTLPAGESTLRFVTPKTGLTAGLTYTDTVTVSGDTIADYIFHVKHTAPQPRLLGSAAIGTGAPVVGDVLTVTTDGITASDGTTLTGTFSYQWYYVDIISRANIKIAGVTGTSYTVSGAEVGQNIFCAVTSSAVAGSAMSNVRNNVQYKVRIEATGAESGEYAKFQADMVSPQVDVESGAANKRLYVVYNLTDDGGKPYNALTFTGGTNLAAVTAPTGGLASQGYDINPADAVDGVITIKAIFMHSASLQPQTLTFANGSRIKTWLTDTGFTEAAAGASGSGSITYTSSNTGVATVANSGAVSIEGAGTTTITATIAADGTYAAASASYTLTVNNAVQSAPIGIDKTDETASGNDGTITGVDSTMEYKLQTDDIYTAVTGSTVTGLAPGTYDVRYAARTNYDASPAEEVTIVPYSMPAYTVTFMNDGAAHAARTVMPPSTAVGSLPSIPEKSGYAFDGWYTAANGGGTEFVVSTPVTESVTVYAYWLMIIDDNTAPTVTDVYPSGTGTAINGDIVITFSETMSTTSGAVSLNGIELWRGSWSDGNTVYAVPYSYLDYGTSYTVQISDFADAAGNMMADDNSHSFTTAAEPAGPLTGTATISNAAPKVGDVLTGSLVGGSSTGTLSYVWKANGSVVGSGISYTVKAADVGKAITLEITSSVETGSVISAATAPVGRGAVMSASGGGNAEDSFRVLFESNGGGAVVPVTGLSYGDRVVAPPTPVRDGYTFGGWYRDEECTVVWTFAGDAVAGDMTLYAKWVGGAVTATAASAVITTATTSSTVTGTATATADESPAATEAPAPVFGVLAGLGAAGVLMRKFRS